MSLNKLKNLNLDRYDIEDLIELYGYGSFILVTTYKNLGIQVPEWLVTNLATLKQRIDTVTRDEKLRQLEMAKAAYYNRLPNSVKLQSEADKIKKLSQELGLSIDDVPGLGGSEAGVNSEESSQAAI